MTQTAVSPTPDSPNARRKLVGDHRGDRGASARTLRASNLSLVLQVCLAGRGQISRADIAMATHMTRATVSRLVDELLESRILEQRSPQEEGGPGRPATPVAARPGAVVAMGLQVNIGYLAVRVVDLAGSVLGDVAERGDYRNSDWREVMPQLAQLARRARHDCVPDDALYLGAALGLPGLVSPTGLAVAPNLGWHELTTEELFGPLAPVRPVVVQNEADLAAFAVSHPLPGVPSGPPSFIFVSGEVGIGAGIMLDHRPLSGVHGWSGEIGHICVDPAGSLCTCGANGCLETFLGQRALAQRAGLDRDAQPADVLAAAHRGSEPARRAIREGGSALGRVMAGVINTIDVPLVLVGDTLAQLGADLLGPVTAELGRRVLQARAELPRVQLLGNNQRLTTTGGAHTVLQRLVDDPIAWSSRGRRTP